MIRESEIEGHPLERRYPIATLTVLGTTVLLAFGQTAHAGPETIGGWSWVIRWDTQTVADAFFPATDFYVRDLLAVHAANLPDSSPHTAPNHKLLLWGLNTKCPTPHPTRALWFNQDWANGHGLTLPPNDATANLLCAGHTFTSAGIPLVVGGEQWFNYRLFRLSGG